MQSNIICFGILTLTVFSSARSTSGSDVTNEQLRDGLLSLVHSYSLLENKLDRHEQRERALGDVVKRGLQTLQKGQKIFEPMRGTFARLDERISEIETELMTQDKKNADQQEKLGRALDTILKWMVDNTVGGIEKPKSNNDNIDDDENPLFSKVDELTKNVETLQKQIGELISDKETSAENTKRLLDQIEKLNSVKTDSTDEVLSKMEEKLTHFYVTSSVSTPSPIRNTEWEANVAELLTEIKSNTLAEKVANINLDELAAINRNSYAELVNTTLDAIEDMRMEVLTASDKSFVKTGNRIKEATDKLETGVGEVLKSVTESEASFEEIIRSNNNLQKDIKALGNLEKIVLDAADNILAIKRGMEFNVHAITLEVGDLIKTNAKETNSTFYKRFDALNETILTNQNGALSNLTSKIETEISQVWRQIGIMYQEVSSSKQALNKLQELTEGYVNGTFTTMDSMEGKVSQITGRMQEVDNNLNFLLGRLSLVTHEFNQIKSGLGSALDNIRSSFMIVQDKIKDSGPGPHNIPSEENETDFNLPTKPDDQPSKS